MDELNNEDVNVRMNGTERIYTFGGESWIDDFRHADYGIDFEKISIYNLSPKQMIALACIMVDHLLLNGHSFEVQRTHEQDQTERLVCLDTPDENDA